MINKRLTCNRKRHSTTMENTVSASMIEIDRFTIAFPSDDWKAKSAMSCKVKTIFILNHIVIHSLLNKFQCMLLRIPNILYLNLISDQCYGGLYVRNPSHLFVIYNKINAIFQWVVVGSPWGYANDVLKGNITKMALKLSKLFTIQFSVNK